MTTTRSAWISRRNRPLCTFAATILTLVTSLALAQNAAPTASATTPAKPLAFDVVSIRPSRPDGLMMTGFTPTGYIANGFPLSSTIMAAYYPLGMRYWFDQLRGSPPWVGADKYDIEAKLDEATIQQWKDLTTAQRSEKMKPLLQAMLADRCKLVLHTTAIQVPGFALTVGKHGITFQQAVPNSPTPSGGSPLGGGGWIVHQANPGILVFKSVSMATVADTIMTSGQSPIEDRTGLTGAYDLTIPKKPYSDPDGASDWNVEDLGLELKSAKVSSVALVVDSIQKPSAN